MEQSIERMMKQIKRNMMKEIRKENQQNTQTASDRKQKMPSTVMDKVARELATIHAEIRQINIRLDGMQPNQPASHCNCECMCKNCARDQSSQHHRRNQSEAGDSYDHRNTAQFYRRQLDDHQVRQALYNPEEVNSRHTRREKRRSYYDEAYRQAEQRIEDVGRSMYVGKARSKISSMVRRDKLHGVQSSARIRSEQYR